MLVGFSFMTGNFPPQKDEVFKVAKLIKDIYLSTENTNKMALEMNQAENTGQSVSLEQMVNYQRMVLQRSEMTLELSRIYKKIPMGSGNPEIDRHLARTLDYLQQAEIHLEHVTQRLQTLQSGDPQNL